MVQMNLSELKEQNKKRWADVKVLKETEFTHVARRLLDPIAKQRYQKVETETTVPWYVIAIIHERESSQNWHTNLAQGDPWDRVSVHVPKGRGPFRSWEEAAIDALCNCYPHLARVTDWSVGGLLAALEQYNGLGYYEHHHPSPYIWSGTNQYKAGKYVRDGVFDPHVVDEQLGCAGLLLTMAHLDPDIPILPHVESPPLAPLTMAEETPFPPVESQTATVPATEHPPSEPWWKRLWGW